MSCLCYYALVGAVYFAGGTATEVMSYARSPLASLYASGSAVALVGVLIATAGLLARQRWAAYVHVASTVLMIGFSGALDAPVPMGPTALLSVAIYVLTGIIYGLAFFTDALADADKDS